MGGTQTVIEYKTEVREVESEESKKMKALLAIDEQLGALKEEVEGIPFTITAADGAVHCVENIKDATVIRYSNLKDKDKMLENIHTLFAKSPALEMVSEEAKRMVTVLNSTDEMKEIKRWHSHKLFKKVNKNVFGMELHYKVTAMEEYKKTGVISSHTDTILAIVYKCVVHQMEADPSKFPDSEEVSQLTF